MNVKYHFIKEHTKSGRSKETGNLTEHHPRFKKYATPGGVLRGSAISVMATLPTIAVHYHP